MREVEILVRLFENKEKVMRTLKRFELKEIITILDIYFYNPKSKKLLPDKRGVLKECFRLRKKVMIWPRKGHRSFLTYKKDLFEKSGKWLCSEEHEIEASDFQTAKEIVHHLGLTELIEIKNKRYVFNTPKYEIVFEDVEKLGLFLEVEYKHLKKRSIDSIKKDIWIFIESLNLRIGKELNEGKPALLLKKVGFGGKKNG